MFFCLYILPIYSVLPAQFSLPITILQCFVNLVFLPIEPVYSVLLTYYYTVIQCLQSWTVLFSVLQVSTVFTVLYSVLQVSTVFTVLYSVLQVSTVFTVLYCNSVLPVWFLCSSETTAFWDPCQLHDLGPRQ